jgi:hypothetical protein
MKQVSLLVLALAFATGHAIAAPQSQSHAAHAPATAPAAADDTTKAFDALDTNKDGQLSKEELAKDPMGAHAAMVDADRNGSLSREEFTALQKMKM